MGMPAVTGIDDVDVIQPVLVQVPGDQKWGAGLGMADDEHVGMHRRQIIDGVEQRFSLAGG